MLFSFGGVTIMFWAFWGCVTFLRGFRVQGFRVGQLDVEVDLRLFRLWGGLVASWHCVGGLGFSAWPQVEDASLH